MTKTIIQWNLNGFFPRKENLKRIILNHEADVICLQETNFKGDYCAPIRGFTNVFKNRQNANHASGGVAIYLRDSLSFTKINLNTNIEAIAVTCFLPSKISICNIYLPNSYTFTKLELLQLISQLPRPFILLGDFNGHSTLWGSTKLDQRGKIIEELLDDVNDIILLNHREPTHFNPANGMLSAIDLTIQSSALADKSDWEVLAELYDSDHFPIKISIADNCPKTTSEPRRNFKKANWQTFQSTITDKLNSTVVPTLDSQNNIDQLFKNFSDIINDAADKSIPSFTPQINTKQVPWWNDDCKEALRKSHHAFNKYKKHNTTENKIEYNMLRAKCRRQFKEAQKTCWLDFLSTLKHSAPPHETWNKIKRISGTKSSSHISTIVRDNGTLISSSENIANELAMTFAKNSSDLNYDKKFLSRKRQAPEINQAHLYNNDNKELNNPILIQELISILNTTKNTSPGPDNIPNILLKNLPYSGLNRLTTLFNLVWNNQVFPSMWSQAVIIPIPKPGKDKTNPKNYRPIALTSTMCKLLEKILNKRLKAFLEKNNFFCSQQNGFRQNRSTTDHLLKLEAIITDAFVKKLHVVMVSLDIEKAFEMVWRQRIVQILIDKGVKGNMIAFIINFLRKRQMQVKVNGKLSDHNIAENGVPQGSVLSVTLFLTAINDIVRNIQKPINCCLFADDLTIICTGKNLAITQQLLQETLDNLQNWAELNGFKFSFNKTEYQILSRKHIPNEDLNLRLYNNKINKSLNLKILGLTFDNKLNWKFHISELKNKCRSKLNIIKALAAKTWGADKRVLLNTYKSLILSRLDYGSIIYDSSRFTSTLDPLHHTALKLAIGAYHTSPTLSVLAESCEIPLYLRRKKLCLEYYSKIMANPENPTHKYITTSANVLLYDSHAAYPKPLSLRAKNYQNDLNIILPQPFIQTHKDTRIPSNLKFCDRLLQLDKKNTSTLEYQTAFAEAINENKKSITIYTDGSLSQHGAGCAIVTPTEDLRYPLPPHFSIFSCEAYAILKALEYIKNSADSDFTICSDSNAAITAIQNPKSKNNLISRIQEEIDTISNKTILLLWVPSHQGIVGNELADRAAKIASSMPIQQNQIASNSQDIRTLIRKKIEQHWNEKWINSAQTSKLFNIRTNTFTLPPTSKLNRRDQVITTRLRIGHTKLTHSYLLNKTDPPKCDRCDQLLTINHLILQCPSFRQARTSNKITDNLKDGLNDEDEVRKIINFIRSVNLEHEI